jgi:hypothetical protein
MLDDRTSSSSRLSKTRSDTHEIFSPQQDLRPRNQYLTEVTDGDGDYCVMLCSLPPGCGRANAQPCGSRDLLCHIWKSGLLPGRSLGNAQPRRCDRCAGWRQARLEKFVRDRRLHALRNDDEDGPLPS